MLLIAKYFRVLRTTFRCEGFNYQITYFVFDFGVLQFWDLLKMLKHVRFNCGISIYMILDKHSPENNMPQ